jgi:hypothetical protein
MQTRLVSVTRLKVEVLAARPGLRREGVPVGLSSEASPGNLAVEILREANNNTFWTCTAWVDENAMKAFMLAGVHRDAMKRLLDWCDEASVVHWIQDAAELPSWDESHRRMREEGRRSKVNFPSADHVAFRIAPIPTRSAGLRLK